MNALLAGAIFGADVLLVVAAAWLILRAVGGVAQGVIEPLLGWCLMMLGLIAGPGVVLGLAGWLDCTGFLVAHVGLLALGLILRRGQWQADIAAGRAWLAQIGRSLTGHDWVSRGCAGLAGLILGLALLAAWADPLIHDVLAYRLPRIGLWLNEGKVAHFATMDPRINYMPWVQDLLTVWVLGATTSGWLLVALPQTFGGALLLVATIGLARQNRLSRGAALGAACLVLGLANIAVQFTTAQADLFTAGVLAAAVCLWQGALLRGRGSVVGGLGAALALGSKGTVFYMAPGLLVLVVYLAVRQRVQWREWRLTLAGALLGFGLWVAPVHGMNYATYGGAFGPAEWVAMHHGEPGLGWVARTEKLWINLRSSAVQLFDPHATPAGFRAAAKATGLKLAATLPSDEAAVAAAFQGLDRRGSLEAVLNFPGPNPDMLGVGVLPVLAFILAVIALSRSRKVAAANRLTLIGALVIGVYVICQHAIFQWHVWALRLMTLAAPWWAVTVAAGLETASRRWRLAGWMLMSVTGLSVFWHVTVWTAQAGWQVVINPAGAPSALVESAWERWAPGLTPANSPVILALEEDRPIAAFLRQLPARRVELREVIKEHATAADLVAGLDGWLVTPLSQFRGREGEVYARTWINPSDSGDGYSLAAYRKLAPGEKAAPVLYRNRRADTDKHAARSLVVRTWSNGAVPLRLSNPRAEPCHWLVLTAAREYRGEIAAGGTATPVIELPADGLAEVMILFRCPPGGLAPEVGLAE